MKLKQPLEPLGKAPPPVVRRLRGHRRVRSLGRSERRLARALGRWTTTALQESSTHPTRPGKTVQNREPFKEYVTTFFVYVAEIWCGCWVVFWVSGSCKQVFVNLAFQESFQIFARRRWSGGGRCLGWRRTHREGIGRGPGGAELRCRLWRSGSPQA